MRGALLVISILAAAAAGGVSGANSQGLGKLRPAGTLYCTASAAEAAAKTNLQCRLHLDGSKRVAGKYEGVVLGRGLYLVAPKGTQVQWKVLSAVALEPGDLEGDYDIVSKHSFQYERRNNSVLVGGRNDLVALELVAPRADVVKPSTRLTLRKLG